MPDEPTEYVPRELHQGLGIATSVLGVGLFVAGVQLLVTCETSTNLSSGSVGCTYPFQGYALWFLFFSGVSAIVAANLFASSVSPTSPKGVRPTIRYVRSAILAMGFACLAIVFALVLGVA